MTELYEVATGAAPLNELMLKVTKSLTGLFLVGLFYEQNGLLYCYSVPGNERKANWRQSPDEAIKAWHTSNPGDSREVINPYLVQEDGNEWLD